MEDKNKVAAESASAESANAAAVAQEAAQKAVIANMVPVVEDAIARFFNRGVQEKKFIDIGRIPFICDDINGIHTKLNEWDKTRVTKEDFGLLKQTADLTNKIVFAVIALICLAFMGALFALIFK